VDGQVQKGLNSIIILGAWSVLNHCSRAFDGILPKMSRVLLFIGEELFPICFLGIQGLVCTCD